MEISISAHLLRVKICGKFHPLESISMQICCLRWERFRGWLSHLYGLATQLYHAPLPQTTCQDLERNLQSLTNAVVCEAYVDTKDQLVQAAKERQLAWDATDKESEAERPSLPKTLIDKSQPYATIIIILTVKNPISGLRSWRSDLTNGMCERKQGTMKLLKNSQKRKSTETKFHMINKTSG